VESFVIIRETNTSPDTLGVVKELLKQKQLWMPEDGAIPEWVALPGFDQSCDNFSRAHAFLASRLQSGFAITAIVDKVNPALMDPLASNGWSSLIAMLVLAFPEVRWVFLVVCGKPSILRDSVSDSESRRSPAKTWRTEAEALTFIDIHGLVESRHGVCSLGEPRGSPLFDGHGLRQIVRWNLARRRREDAGFVPSRPALALVLDDEGEFSLFLSICAYSRGFRVHCISSMSEATSLLGRGVQAKEVGGQESFDHCARLHRPKEMFLLSIEDLFVNFPDKGRNHLSSLIDRERELPGLSRCPRRRFVTVGHERQRQTAMMRRRYMDNLRQAERNELGRRLPKNSQVILKPASGLYTMWREMGMFRTLRKGCEGCLVSGFAPGFVWPPATSASSAANDESDGHSSPGRLLQIAEHLILRASAMTEAVDGVSAAVRGAVLATQALELLGCKTPTLSVEALSLRHRFEVTAECKFVGVEYHLSVRERLNDIRRNLKAMAYWIHRGRRRAFCLNSEARILSRLVAIFDAHGEFEESHLCQLRLRTLHRQISAAEDWRRGRFLRVMFWPFWMYVNWTHRSLAHFFWTMIAVIGGFTLLFHCSGIESYPMALDQTIRCMIDTSPVEKPEHFYQALIGYAAAGAGLVHFGILVSYIYEMVKRR
jgi:hypothetical protein